MNLTAIGRVNGGISAGGRMRIIRNLRYFVLVCLLAVTAGATAHGQNAVARNVSGMVADVNGAAIAGAAVSVAGPAARAAALTNSDGGFSFLLPASVYSLTVQADGFAGTSQTVDLASGDRLNSKIVLQIASATAMVTVSDDTIYNAGSISTATKTYTLLRDVPQSVTIIKSEQMSDQMMSSVADVVRYVPGVSAHQGENNRDDLVIRGNRSSADLYRDGVRDDVQYFRDLYNLERVETIKGPNAMAFGRGGGGGVINRVTKEAAFSPIREFTAQAGSFHDRRFTADIGEPLGHRAAFRVNGVYENSASFRQFVGLRRFGINPTITIVPDDRTHITLGYEYARDRRTADRGITSFHGVPADVPISTFYGDPSNSRVRSDVAIFSGSIDRVFGPLTFRNRTSYGDYDRFYQNYVPGTANAAMTLVTLTAYNNATRRKNLFNQTDLNYSLLTGRVRHVLAFGTEFGTQRTRNFRNTGYFNDTATSIQVAHASPQTNAPVTFRQSATDADNHVRLDLGAAYVQDQLEISRYLQVIAGVRYDHFSLGFFNDRTGETLRRTDRLISPRIGVVIKPFTAVSLYGSYSVSFLPGSGDQFSSLTVITQQLKPERFTNYELGAKWDMRRGLFLTIASYRLDRTNTRSTDPNDPTRIIQTGSQRTNGVEIGLTGTLFPKWTVSGGYAYQDARITSATTAAVAGKQVGQVPHNTISMWNKYAVTGKLSVGLGVIYRSDMFAAVDNTVKLAGYAKAAAAVFYTFNEHWRLQANIENLTNVRYYANADSNTNISPGAPLGLRVGLIARF